MQNVPAFEIGGNCKRHRNESEKVGERLILENPSDLIKVTAEDELYATKRFLQRIERSASHVGSHKF